MGIPLRSNSKVSFTCTSCTSLGSIVFSFLLELFVVAAAAVAAAAVYVHAAGADWPVFGHHAAGGRWCDWLARRDVVAELGQRGVRGFCRRRDLCGQLAFFGLGKLRRDFCRGCVLFVEAGELRVLLCEDGR